MSNIEFTAGTLCPDNIGNRLELTNSDGLTFTATLMKLQAEVLTHKIPAEVPSTPHWGVPRTPHRGKQIEEDAEAEVLTIWLWFKEYRDSKGQNIKVELKPTDTVKLI